jgi:hypothetical protein
VARRPTVSYKAPSGERDGPYPHRGLISHVTHLHLGWFIVSKLSKLVRDPRAFVADSKIFQRVTAAVDALAGTDDKAPPQSPTKARKPEAAAKGKPKKKAHPLPTLNHAYEKRLSERELKEWKETKDFFRFATSQSVRDRVIGRLAGDIGRHMDGMGFPSRDYLQVVRSFLDSFGENPAAGSARTTAVGSLLWLHTIAQALQSEVLVESGVFKGASLYTLRAACPDAKVFAFDIDLSNLTFRDPSIEYHEGDWSEAFPKPSGPNDLIYFDDHINNCLRVRQAYDQGFRHVVFDDSPDIGELHKWRYPGVPTVQMAFNGTIEPGESVAWVWKNRKLEYTYDLEHTHGALDVIEEVVELPSLSALTGQRTGVQTYVRLRGT